MKRATVLISLFVCCIGVAYGQPVFKDSKYALSDFLKKNIIYPEYSKENCISGTIQVSFRLDSAGNVANAVVHRGMDIDLDDEALRVIKLTSGKWNVPAGYDVSTNIILPVTFTTDDYRCTGVSRKQINTAISYYKDLKNLEAVVITYYQNKYAGKADTTAEANIISLKKQLGYDDEYIEDILEQADRKWKQGDKAGACTDWYFIRYIGSTRADKFIAKNCGQ